MLGCFLFGLAPSWLPKEGLLAKQQCNNWRSLRRPWRCSWHRASDQCGPCSQGGFQGSFPCFFFTCAFYATPEEQLPRLGWCWEPDQSLMAEVTFATRSEVASPTAKPGMGQAINIFSVSIALCPTAFDVLFLFFVFFLKISYFKT